MVPAWLAQSVGLVLLVYAYVSWLLRSLGLDGRPEQRAVQQFWLGFVSPALICSTWEFASTTSVSRFELMFVVCTLWFWTWQEMCARSHPRSTEGGRGVEFLSFAREKHSLLRCLGAAEGRSNAVVLSLTCAILLSLRLLSVRWTWLAYVLPKPHMEGLSVEHVIIHLRKLMHFWLSRKVLRTALDLGLRRVVGGRARASLSMLRAATWPMLCASALAVTMIVVDITLALLSASGALVLTAFASQMLFSLTATETAICYLRFFFVPFL